jgi:hypothetical protein
MGTHVRPITPPLWLVTPSPLFAARAFSRQRRLPHALQIRATSPRGEERSRSVASESQGVTGSEIGVGHERVKTMLDTEPHTVYASMWDVRRQGWTSARAALAPVSSSPPTVARAGAKSRLQPPTAFPRSHTGA